MDKFSFAQNGVVRLPPGFRFQPTDEELVFRYLKCKVFSCPLPASIIPEVNVCNYDPWDLPGDLEQERYFFCHKEAKPGSRNRTKRTTNSGYWKANGSDKKIVSSTRNHMEGMKKTLVFYSGNPSQGSRTDWIMHEYRLVSAGTTSCVSPQIHNASGLQNSLDQVEKWVICRIFLKPGSTINNNVIIQNIRVNKVENVGMAQPRLLDFRRGYEINLDRVSSSCSSSSSSCSITEVSSREADHHEEGRPSSKC